jgi:hypothetical protein
MRIDQVQWIATYCIATGNLKLLVIRGKMRRSNGDTHCTYCFHIPIHKCNVISAGYGHLCLFLTWRNMEMWSEIGMNLMFKITHLLGMEKHIDKISQMNYILVTRTGISVTCIRRKNCMPLSSRRFGFWTLEVLLRSCHILSRIK